jgi:hypothetical protein
MNKTIKKIIIAIIAMMAVAVLILAGYFLMYKKIVTSGETEESLPKTEVGKLEAKDLELKYPGTPTEVVKLYWRFNQCIYNTSMKEKDLEALLKQLRMLYDEELLQEDGNSYKEMLATLKKEKKEFTKDKRFISSYVVDEDKDVVYGKIDGTDCATLVTSTLETVNKSKSTQTYEKFICRQNEDGKWKIVGWEKTDASTEEEE